MTEFDIEIGEEIDIPINELQDVLPMSPDRRELLTSLAAAATMRPITLDKAVDYQLEKDRHDATLSANNEIYLRREIARIRASQNVEVFDTMMGNLITRPDITPEQVQAMESYSDLREEMQAREDYDALESMALTNLGHMATEHPEYLEAAQIALLDPDHFRAGEYVQDQLERSLILQRESQKIAEQYENDSWVATAVNYLAMMIPFNRVTGSDVDPSGDFWNLSGTNLNIAGTNLMNSSREVFDATYPVVIDNIMRQSGIFTNNTLIAREFVDDLRGMTDSRIFNSNAFDVIDILATVPFGASIKLTKAAILRLSSKPISVDVAASTLKADELLPASPITGAEEAIEATMTSSMRVTNDGLVSEGAAIANKLAVQEDAISILKIELAGEGQARLTPQELQAAYDSAFIEAQKRFGKAAVTDFRTAQDVVQGIPFRHGTAKLDVLIGRKDGIGFAKESYAKGKGTRLFGEGNYSIYTDKDGMFFVKHEIDVSEKNFAILNRADISDGTVVGTFLRSAASMLPRIMQNRATRADFSASATRRIMKPILKGIQGLNKKSREAIEAVWVRGRDGAGVDKYGKRLPSQWFNDIEFTSHFRQLNGRAPTDKELLGYYSLKNLNDFEYTLRNHAMYLDFNAQGFVTGQLQHTNLTFGMQNLKRIERVGDMRKTTMYDVNKGKVISGRDISESVLEGRLKSGDELFMLKKPKVIDGVHTQYILAPKGSMKIRALKYDQLPYVAGGHRIYDGTIFIKQARVGIVRTSNGGAQSYIMNPKTHAVMPTMGDAAAYVKRMEGARLAYVAYKEGRLSLAEANTITKNAGFENGVDEIEELISGGKMEMNQPFEALRDGEHPAVWARMKGEDGVMDMRVMDEGLPSWMEDHGRLYYSRRGAALPGPQDELAQTLDPFAVANRAVDNAVSTASYMNYKINAVQRWMNEFGHLLAKDAGRSDLDLFWSGALRSDVGGETARLAERSRVVIRNQIGHPSKFGRDMQEAVAKLADWVEGAVPGRVGHAAAKTLLDVQSKDPAGSLKALSFDLKLGMFDPSQIIIQTQTAFAMATINPLKAPAFFRDAAAMRWAVLNTHDNILNSAAKLSTMDVDEFKVMVRALRKSGGADPSGEMVLTGKHSSAFVTQPASVVGFVRDKGRIFFYEAERLNRMYAWRMGWDDLREAGHSVKFLQSAEGLSMLTGKLDQFSMNMINASAASWQKGLLSVPTQFLSYQARFIENVLPKTFGGNPQWTSGQKLRLATGQLFLYGAMGIPAGRAIAEYATNVLGIDLGTDDFMENVATRAILGGMFDSMIYAATLGEVDVAFGARAAVMGKGLEDLLKGLYGSGINNKSFLEVLAGAPFGVAGDLGSDLVNGLMDIYTTATSEQAYVADMLPGVLADIADNMSVFSRAQKAYWILEYGQWISQESGKVLAEATPMEAIAAALGIQPRDIAEMDYMRLKLDEDKSMIRKMAKIVRKRRLEAWRARGKGDHDEFKRILHGTSALLSGVDPRRRRAIVDSASRMPRAGSAFDEMRYQIMKHFSIEEARDTPTPNTSR